MERKKHSVMTKARLAKKLGKPGLSLRVASVYIDVLTEAIIEMLSRGEKIQIRGFGTFAVKKQAARKTAINGDMEIPEHGKVIFKPCESLRKAVWDLGKFNRLNQMS